MKLRYQPDRPIGCTCRTPIELADDQLHRRVHLCGLHDAKQIKENADEAERVRLQRRVAMLRKLRADELAEDAPPCRCSTPKQILAAALNGVELDRCELHDPSDPTPIPAVALNDSEALARLVGIPHAD